jgi:integrase
MHPAVGSPAITTQPLPAYPQEGAWVSALSVFSDDRWDFTTEIGDVSLSIPDKTINWKFKVTEDRDSFHPAYATMLLALKQLAYTMLFLDKPRKCVTVVRNIARLKCFVRFLSEGERPIYRFQDVLATDLESYIEHLKMRADGKGEVMPRTYSRLLVILNKLFEYRDYLSDHLRFRPTKDKTPNKVAGCQENVRVNTKPIHDDQLKKIIDVSLDYIQKRAGLIFQCLVEFHLFAKDVDFGAFKSSDVKSRYIERHFFSRRNDIKSSTELNSSLVRLRTACFIMIAFCTGMRMSELLAIQRGCISKRKDANHGTFYWLKSLLFKTQKKNAGSFRYWMCGKLAAEAVSVMERMGELLGAHHKTPYLFFAFSHYNLIDRTKARTGFNCLSVGKCQFDLKAFCTLHHLASGVHVHRFRRSFARNIIRYSTTPILALKDHFKHWSLYMTDWYVGLDYELIEDLEAERLLLSIELMEKICTQPISGAGGRRWSQELDRRIAEGKLPRNFRGKAGAEFRQEMIVPLHESGAVISRCGTFTNCIFQPDGALCTDGDSPVVNLCNPYSCINSVILPENVPFYREKLANAERLYNALSEEAKCGPVGQFYQREIRMIRRVLEPFEK